jgi:hypothetical protein
MNELVKMRKDGKEIEVSPLTVKDHKSLGWVVVGEDPTAAAPADAPKAGKKSRPRSGPGKKAEEPKAPAE